MFIQHNKFYVTFFCFIVILNYNETRGRKYKKKLINKNDCKSIILSNSNEKISLIINKKIFNFKIKVCLY